MDAEQSHGCVGCIGCRASQPADRWTLRRSRATVRGSQQPRTLRSLVRGSGRCLLHPTHPIHPWLASVRSRRSSERDGPDGLPLPIDMRGRGPQTPHSPHSSALLHRLSRTPSRATDASDGSDPGHRSPRTVGRCDVLKRRSADRNSRERFRASSGADAGVCSIRLIRSIRGLPRSGHDDRANAMAPTACRFHWTGAGRSCGSPSAFIRVHLRLLPSAPAQRRPARTAAPPA